MLSIFPALLLFILGPGSEKIDTYNGITHLLGQISGLIAMTMFALTFILSTRLKFIEDIFGGLDKAYIIHAIFGGTAFILAMFHPIFLVLKYIPADIRLAASYLLPSSHWSVNFGIIALLGMVLLLYFTFYTKMRYNYWKISHKFFGFFFIIAALHIFLITDLSQDYIFKGYYIYATIVSIIGFAGFFYSLFIKNKLIRKAIYKIETIKQKNGQVHDIIMTPVFKPIKYKSGQFIFIQFFNKHLSREPHPFSIASRSDYEKIRVVIKNLGDYTSKLNMLKPGNRVSIEGPYGRFNHERNDRDQIWIAAGIGITPFIGMAEDVHHNKIKGKIDLYYSVRQQEDFISLDFFKKVQIDKKNFNLIPWITSKKGRITANNIKNISKNFKNKEFYMCGPQPFKDDIRKGLIKHGVSKKNIFEEEFSFR